MNGEINAEMIGEFVLWMVALVFSLSLHEFGHAWTSNYFGDDLARSQGRVSLSPVTHVDPIGTLLFPALAFFTGAPLLGWARPVPVNPARWQNYRVANFWVSAAGIILNLALAVIAGIGFRLFYEPGVTGSAIISFLWIMFNLNVGLAVFNLLPFPPLDGSKIARSFLPDSALPALDAVEQYGFILLWVGVITGVFRPIFSFVRSFSQGLLMIGT
ncbi:MAG: site-2 protease family protein [Pyrinomonadaceae bacterium MAG19_C2-C3]|nr:site-2 protease family protein [Pyrinomonadaceae bacterium MAG19_C2-C3]